MVRKSCCCCCRRPSILSHRCCCRRRRCYHHRCCCCCLLVCALRSVGRGVKSFLGIVYLIQLFGFSLIQEIESKVFATQLSQRIVVTQYGKLRGILVTPPGGSLPQVEAFLGLEYASLLGGELRFMPPTSPVGKWEGVRNAVKFKPVCPQKLPDLDELQKRHPSSVVDHYRRLLPFLERQQEDCLSLNVYVPVRDKNDSSLFPVLVFIHGESYDIGSGNAYEGSILSAFGRIVVVTLNYRLGILGFLTTNDSHAPGNYGLLDQVAALHWVADNIKAFGGNPRQVTLMGHRYGAAMINILLVSPVTKGKSLFQRAIVHSGSALASWSVTSDPLLYTRRLADHLNCSTVPTNSILTIQCLKQFSVEDLVNADVPSPKYLSRFGPTLDGRSVLPDRVSELATGRSICLENFGSTALLVGVGYREGADYFPQAELDEGLTQIQWTRVLRTFVQNVYRYHQQKICDILTHNYRDWDRTLDPRTSRDELIELIGDGQHVAPTIQLAKEHAACEASPTFMFGFDGVSAGPQGSPSRLNELALVFGAPLADGIDPFISTYTEQEKALSETVLSYWTSFIRSGDPNDRSWMDPSRDHIPLTKWSSFDLTNQKYLLIGPVSRVYHHYKSHKMALWLELIPRIHKPDVFNPLLHLLDDYNNRSSFEEEGTREIEPSELFPTSLTSSSTGVTWQTTSGFSSSTDIHHEPSNIESLRSVFQTPEVTRKDYNHRRVTSSPNQDGGFSSPTSSSMMTSAIEFDIVTVVSSNDATGGGEGGSSTLGVTVAVGCALLALNTLVFAATFCQWHRLGRILRARQDELGKDSTGTGYSIDVHLSQYNDALVPPNDRCLSAKCPGGYNPSSVLVTHLSSGGLEDDCNVKRTGLSPHGSPTLSSALLGNSASLRSPLRIERQSTSTINRRNSVVDDDDDDYDDGGGRRTGTPRASVNHKYSTTIV